MSLVWQMQLSRRSCKRASMSRGKQAKQSKAKDKCWEIKIFSGGGEIRGFESGGGYLLLVRWRFSFPATPLLQQRSFLYMARNRAATKEAGGVSGGRGQAMREDKEEGEGGDTCCRVPPYLLEAAMAAGLNLEAGHLRAGSLYKGCSSAVGRDGDCQEHCGRVRGS